MVASNRQVPRLEVLSRPPAARSEQRVPSMPIPNREGVAAHVYVQHPPGASTANQSSNPYRQPSVNSLRSRVGYPSVVPSKPVAVPPTSDAAALFRDRYRPNARATRVTILTGRTQRTSTGYNHPYSTFKTVHLQRAMPLAR
jgi:hypothetical protein